MIEVLVWLYIKLLEKSASTKK